MVRASVVRLKRNPRILRYLGVYVVVMCLATAMVPVWHVTDWWVLALLLRDWPEPDHDEIVLFDVAYESNVTTFRNSVADVLRAIAARREDLPRAIVLDIAFLEGSGGARALASAIEQLKTLEVSVYGAVDPRFGNSDRLDPNYMNRHDRDIYAALTGRGHTRIEHLFGVGSYMSWLEINSEIRANGPGQTQLSTTEIIEAIPVLVARKDYKVPVGFEAERILFRVGSADELRVRTHAVAPHGTGESGFAASDSMGPSGPEALSLRGKLVVVGSLRSDRSPLVGLSGSEVIAFAISDRIQRAHTMGPPKLLANPILLLILVATSSILTVVAFLISVRLKKRKSLGISMHVLIGASTGVVWIGRGRLRYPDWSMWRRRLPFQHSEYFCLAEFFAIFLGIVAGLGATRANKPNWVFAWRKQFHRSHLRAVRAALRRMRANEKNDLQPMRALLSWNRSMECGWPTRQYWHPMQVRPCHCAQ